MRVADGEPALGMHLDPEWSPTRLRDALDGEAIG